MSDPYHVTLSRRLCGSLCLRAGPLTSLDLALWVAFVSEAAVMADEPNAAGVTMRDTWIVGDAAAVEASGRTLLAATGMRSHVDLVRPFQRLAESEVSLGLLGDDRHRLWQGWEADPIDRACPRATGYVSGMCLAQAMIAGDPFPVVIDTAAMARFSSRWSALIYLRGLGWLNGVGTPRSWKRTGPGPHVRVTIPLDEIHRGLGTDALQGVGAWNARAFGTGGKAGPVHEDLESAGLRLRTTWVSERVGTRLVPVALALSITRLKAARRAVPVRIPAAGMAPAA